MRSLVVLALAFVTSCGGSPNAVEVPADELPFPVRRAASPAATDGTEVITSVYYAADGRLAPAARRVADARVESALRALVDGPTERERRSGLKSFLPPSVKILRLTTSPGVLQVDFSEEFQAPAPPSEVHLRIAQVVWTVTEVENIGSVAFSIEGEPLSVGIDGSRTVSRPVRRVDFATVAPAGFVAEP